MENARINNSEEKEKKNNDPPKISPSDIFSRGQLNYGIQSPGFSTE